MKSKHKLILLVVISLSSLISYSQDSLLIKLAKKNLTTFSAKNGEFSGKSWDTLISQIRKSDFVLLGEEHFTNEIPYFTSAIINKVKFDNFICEVDPYSIDIIESKIKSLPEIQLKNYRTEFGNTFAFYALEPEFNLLKQLVKTNTSIYGIDQILMNADRLICSNLKRSTNNNTAKKIYEDIEEKSKTYFSNFLTDTSKPMYMVTNEFEKQIEELLSLELSQIEIEKIEALKLSAKIYKEQNHHLRVQLMKSNLMKVIGKWEDKKNLFKYGAGHLPKGEGFLTIHDIGNLVDNIADSKFKSSLNILIVGKSGYQGSPFEGFPMQKIDENNYNNKHLKKLFPLVQGNDWHCFNMQPLKKSLEDGELILNDSGLTRIIKGFDIVIIIPSVTAANFPSK